MSGYPVVLNVYDMYWINQYTFPVGLGVFHSGVVVHGKEYAFGGHPNNWSGIFEMSPKSVEVLGGDFKFRETLTIGTTKLLPSEVEDLLRRMGKDYQGRLYHLIDKNCNHFTSEFCQVVHFLLRNHVTYRYLMNKACREYYTNFIDETNGNQMKLSRQALCNKSIPGWVNRLASVGSYLPFLLKCIPREWISPEPCSPTGSPSYASHPFKDFSGSDKDDQPKNKTKQR